MADDSALSNLLDRAWRVFLLASQLSRSLYEEMPQGDVLLVEPDDLPMVRHHEALKEYCGTIVELREEIVNPPEGFVEVANVLRTAGKIAKWISEFPPNVTHDLYGLFPDLNTVGAKGSQAVREATKVCRPDEPFAFLDETPEANPSEPEPLPYSVDIESIRRCQDEADRVLDAIEASEPIEESVQSLWPSAAFVMHNSPSDDIPTGELNIWMDASRTCKKAILALAIELDMNSKALYAAVTDAESILWNEAIMRAQRRDAAMNDASIAGMQEQPAAGNGASSNLQQQTEAPSKHSRPTIAPGEAEAKLIAALTTWHSYSNGGCDRTEPIGVRRLAQTADVSAGASSQFFKKHFESHNLYKTACRESSVLVGQLKALNGEFRPREFNTLLGEQ